MSNLIANTAIVGGSSSAIVILNYLAQLYGVTLPPEVSTALVITLTPFVHLLAVWLNKKFGIVDSTVNGAGQ